MLAPFLGQAMGMTAGATAALGAGIGAATNKDNPLMGAVSGGLGAFGGANMLNAAKDFGAGAAAEAVASNAGSAAPSVVAPGTAAIPGVAPAAANPFVGINGAAPAGIPGLPSVTSPGFMGATAPQSPFFATQAPAAGAWPPPAAPQPWAATNSVVGANSGLFPTNPAGSGSSGSLWDGAKAVAKDPSGFIKGLDNMETIYPLAGSAMLGGFNKPAKEVEEEGSNVKAKDIKFTQYSQNATPTASGPHWSSEMSYFSPVNRARGGPIDPNAEHGDGMDDATPALIDGKQPAALGSGEYVMDATTVAHLGNGSSAAGFKKLDKMRERVNKARTGGLAQARKINPEKYMPA